MRAPVTALLGLLPRLLTPVLDRRRIATAVKRGAIAAMCVTLAGLALFAAIAMAAAALWVVAAREFGAAGASLLLAGVFMALALLLLLCAWLVTRNKPARPPLVEADPAGALLAAAQNFFAGNKTALLVAAAIAGALVSRGRTRD